MSDKQMYDLISAVFASAAAVVFLVATILMLIEDRIYTAVVSSIFAALFILLVSHLRDKYSRP